MGGVCPFVCSHCHVRRYCFGCLSCVFLVLLCYDFVILVVYGSWSCVGSVFRWCSAWLFDGFLDRPFLDALVVFREALCFPGFLFGLPCVTVGLIVCFGVVVRDCVDQVVVVGGTAVWGVFITLAGWLFVGFFVGRVTVEALKFFLQLFHTFFESNVLYLYRLVSAV